MYQKFLKKDLPIHKQEHLIMQVHKYGNKSPMIKKVIFGQLAVLFIKWLHFHLRLKHVIYKDYIKKFAHAIIKVYQPFIVIN